MFITYYMYKTCYTYMDITRMKILHIIHSLSIAHMFIMHIAVFTYYSVYDIHCLYHTIPLPYDYCQSKLKDKLNKCVSLRNLCEIVSLI